MQVALLYTTFPELQEAEKICRALLEERLIACANLLPGMTSLYRWNENIERTQEIAALLKTSHANIDALMGRLSALHPYDTPCMLCVNADNVGVEYLVWLEKSISLSAA